MGYFRELLRVGKMGYEVSKGTILRVQIRILGYFRV